MFLEYSSTVQERLSLNSHKEFQETLAILVLVKHRQSQMDFHSSVVYEKGIHKDMLCVFLVGHIVVLTLFLAV